jgi:hypothetical protein
MRDDVNLRGRELHYLIRITPAESPTVGIRGRRDRTILSRAAVGNIKASEPRNPCDLPGARKLRSRIIGTQEPVKTPFHGGASGFETLRRDFGLPVASFRCRLFRLRTKPEDVIRLPTRSSARADRQSRGAGFMDAPIWYTTNGGRLWTKQFIITAPPGVPSGAVSLSPCDETFDYGRDGALHGTFLLNGQGEEGASCSDPLSAGEAAGAPFGEVYTGSTADPANAQAWSWFVTNGVTQPTNRFGPDQPWLVVNKDPATAGAENVYVAYQSSEMQQVAVAQAAVPPNFTLDNTTGNKGALGANGGHRIAGDRRSGAIYSLYQAAATITCPGNTLPISYMLNRSTDGGVTWGLNGQANGIAAAVVCSSQLAGLTFLRIRPDHSGRRYGRQKSAFGRGRCVGR